MAMAKKINQKKIFFYFIFVFFVSAATNILAFTRYQEPTVRVAIVRDIMNFEISLNGRYTILNPQTQEVYKTSRSIQNDRVSLTEKGIRIEKEEYPVSYLRIEASRVVSLKIDGKVKKYRGTIDIVKEKNNKLLVINRLDLEPYFKGVLYHEISERWPMDAMKAQAVAVRTYTLYQLEKNKPQLSDQRNDIHSQMQGAHATAR